MDGRPRLSPNGHVVKYSLTPATTEKKTFVSAKAQLMYVSRWGESSMTKTTFVPSSQGYGWPVCSGSVQVNILEASAVSGFYRVLLKLLVMHIATGSQGYSVLLAWLYLGFVFMGFRAGQSHV